MELDRAHHAATDTRLQSHLAAPPHIRPRTKRVSVTKPTDALPLTVPVCPEYEDTRNSGPRTPRAKRIEKRLRRSAGQLPVLARFCKRTARACGWMDDVWAEHALASAGRAPFVHKEVGKQGAGFGAVVQEKAGLLLLSLASRRPVLFWSDSDVFNSPGGGALFSTPGRPVPPSLRGLPPSVGFDTQDQCTDWLRGLGGVKGGIRYRCDQFKSPLESSDGRFIPRLEDGMAVEYIDGLQVRNLP